jgi:hypothetical protein
MGEPVLNGTNQQWIDKHLPDKLEFIDLSLRAYQEMISFLLEDQDESSHNSQRMEKAIHR